MDEGSFFSQAVFSAGGLETISCFIEKGKENVNMEKADIRWLDDPGIFQVNRLPAHSDHVCYPDPESMKKGDSRLYQSLNGTWQFQWSVNAESRPKEFYEEQNSREGFGTIQVPGHMELAGYDRIHYINTMYPWEGQVYRRPAWYSLEAGPMEGQFSQAEYNPVGSYVKIFDLEEGLKGKRVCISFAGVEQAMYVWLNGFFVGYSEDSFTPADFDLTPYIRDEHNVLAVEVHKRSTAAYLEDQDFFRFSGIFRDVTLYAKERVHAEDIWVKPRLCQDGTSGEFSLALRLSAEDEQFQGFSAQYRLEDGQGKILCQGSLPAGPQVVFPTVRLEQVEPWGYGHPRLYELTVELKDSQGRILEIIPWKTGFWRLEISDGVILFNGKRLIINGVNRHEWSAQTGRAITRQDMEADMKIIRRNHINSVRTCHYPNQPLWYHMCDQEGIYLMSETNMESHGSWQKNGRVEPSWNVPGDSPQWKNTVLDRVTSNFETFKNHVSVIFWSLGNESYAGKNIQAMQEYLRGKDPGRLIHYEGVFRNRAYEDTISDMESQMYSPPWDVRAYLENNPKKPFILCEYMHDMGNSLGGMNSYMELLDQYPGYQGGYIWDFIDQALWTEDPVTGEKVLRYGGDFDDRPSDYSFSQNGIVFADRTEKPAMQEVRYYYGKYSE